MTAIYGFTNSWKIENKDKVNYLASCAPVSADATSDIFTAATCCKEIKDQLIQERWKNSSFSSLPRKTSSTQFLNWSFKPWRLIIRLWKCWAQHRGICAVQRVEWLGLQAACHIANVDSAFSYWCINVVLPCTRCKMSWYPIWFSSWKRKLKKPHIQKYRYLPMTTMSSFILLWSAANIRWNMPSNSCSKTSYYLPTNKIPIPWSHKKEMKWL